MRLFLILLALGLVSSDKLDRTYLPPPGSKYAGGSPEDIQLPLEVSKDTYPAKPESEMKGEILKNRQFTLAAEILPNIPNKNSQEAAVQYPIYFPGLAKNDFETLGSVGPENYSINQKQDKLQPDVKISANGFIQQGLASIKNIGEQAPNLEYDVQSNLNQYQGQQPSFLEALGEQNLDVFKHSGRNKPVYFAEQEVVQSTNTPQVISSNFQPNSFGFYGGTTMMKTDTFPDQDLKNNQDDDRVKISSQQKLVYNENGKHDDYKVIKNAYNMPGLKVTSTNAPLDALLPGLSSPNEAYFPNKDEINPTIAYPNRRLQTESEKKAVIINNENVITPQGFAYSFDTSNGIHADENGTAIDGVKAQGAYSYTGDDGIFYSVAYTADENGFQPRGDHLPTPPPVPEAIQQVIEQVAREKEAGIIDDGSYDEGKYGYEIYQGAMDRYNIYQPGQVRQRRPISRTEDDASHNYETLRKEHDKFGNSNISNEGRPSSSFPHKRPSNQLPQKAEDIPKQISFIQTKGYSTSASKENLKSFRRRPVSFLTESSNSQYPSSQEENGRYSVHDTKPIGDGKENSLNGHSIPANKVTISNNEKITSKSHLSRPVEIGARKHSVIEKSNRNERFPLSGTKFSQTKSPQIAKSFVQNKSNKFEEVHNEFDQESGYQYTAPENKFNQDNLPLKLTAQTTSSTIAPEEYETSFPDSDTYYDKAQDGFNQDSQLPVSKKPANTNVNEHTSNINAAQAPSSDLTQVKNKLRGMPKGSLARVPTGVNHNSGETTGVPEAPNFFVPRFGSTRPADEIFYQTTSNPVIGIDRTVPEPSFFNIKPITSSQEYFRRPGIVQTENNQATNKSADRARPDAQLSINVDGFGRPISTSEPTQGFLDSGETDYASSDHALTEAFDGSSLIQTARSHEEEITEKIIGEDFTGPKQPQRYDPETGYHYK